MSSTFATRLDSALSRVPPDMRDRVRARVQARPHDLAKLERAVTGRPVIAATSPSRRLQSTARARPRTLSAELSAAVSDGRIAAGRRAHYERLAATAGEAATIRTLRSLSPGIDPATHAALAASRDAAARDDGAWMRSRPARGWVGAGPRPSRRITWEAGVRGADPVVRASGPELSLAPLPAPLVPGPGHPRANGHPAQPRTGRTPPGLVIDGGPRT
jgi:hypothetical protein